MSGIKAYDPHMPDRRRHKSSVKVLDAVLALGPEPPSHEVLGQTRVTATSRRTVDVVVSELEERGMLDRGPLRLGRTFGYVLSIALGVETCRAALVDANGNPSHAIKLDRVPDQRGAPPEVLLRRVRDAYDKCLAAYRDSPDSPAVPLVGIMTVWPAPVRGNGRPAGPGLAQEWQNHRLQPALRVAVANELAIHPERSHAINDAAAHGLALSFDESRARARLALSSGRDNRSTKIAIILRMGGGIGASTMLLQPSRPARLGWVDSTILGGGRSIAGELAHLPVDPQVVERAALTSSWDDFFLAPLDPRRLCFCGQAGHLEALIGGKALTDRMADSGISTDQLRSALRELDKPSDSEPDDTVKAVSQALHEIGVILGHALAGPVLLLDPSLLILSGSLAREPVRRGIEVARDDWKHSWNDALQVQTVSPDAQPLTGVRGGALAVMRRHVHRQFGELVARDDPADLVVWL